MYSKNKKFKVSTSYFEEGKQFSMYVLQTRRKRACTNFINVWVTRIKTGYRKLWAFKGSSKHFDFCCELTFYYSWPIVVKKLYSTWLVQFLRWAKYAPVMDPKSPKSQYTYTSNPIFWKTGRTREISTLIILAIKMATLIQNRTPNRGLGKGSKPKIFICDRRKVCLTQH